MKLGVSNKFFYYNATGIATFDQKYDLYLTNDINIEFFQEAINKTVDNYPEFKQRIYIKDNKLCAKENDKYPIIFNDYEDRDFASDELNKYPYYFKYKKDEKMVRLSIYHGVADALAIIEFFTSILYHYVKTSNIEITTEDEIEIAKRIRLSKADIPFDDEDEMYDPYFKCHDMNAKPAFKYVCQDAYYFPNKQYDDDANYIHTYRLLLSTSKFLLKTKEVGVSFAPYLAYVLSNSISKHYDIGNKPIVAMLPLDCRRIFNIKTKVNCADGIFLPYTKEDDNKDVKEVCNKIKTYMINQQTKENMQEIMANKVKLINKYENENRSIFDISKERQRMVPITEKHPLTYAMSYSGIIDFPHPLSDMVANFSICAHVRSYSCVCCTYKDNFTVMVTARNDDNEFFSCIRDAFINIGMEVEVKDNGHQIINQIHLEDLKED